LSAVPASKTNEKVVTPPRSKSSTRPTTRDGPGHLKTLESHKGSPPSKKHPTVPNAPKFEDSKAEKSSSIEHSEAQKSPVVEPSVEPVIKNGHAEPAAEEKSEIKDAGESLMTEEIAPAEEPAAITEPPVATTEESAKEEAIPEDSAITPEPELATTTLDDEAIPEDSMIAPEPELSTSLDGEAIPENNAIAPEPEVPTSSLEGGAIPENSAIAPESELATPAREEPIIEEQEGSDVAEEPKITGVAPEEAPAAEQTPSANGVSEQPTEDAID
jgi:hypothetical protein